MVDVTKMANEDLAVLATDEAITELEKRGNTLLEDGSIEKHVKGSELINYPTIAPTDIATVVNGAVVEVNGNPYP
jgi:hypothetical protein